MSGARRLALTALTASAAALTVGCVASGTEILILPLGILAMLGVVGEGRGLGWTPTFWFLAQTGLCAIVRPAQGWALISITCALAYWDLSSFQRRVSKAGRVDRPRSLLRRHLLFLSAALAVGVVLGFVALLVRIEPSSPAGALLLSLVALAGLSLLLRGAQLPTSPMDRIAADQAERNS